MTLLGSRERKKNEMQCLILWYSQSSETKSPTTTGEALVTALHLAT